MGHLNGILSRVGANLNNNFKKVKCPGGGGGGGGMLKLRFDRYITTSKICSDPLDKLFKINKLI